MAKVEIKQYLLDFCLTLKDGFYLPLLRFMKNSITFTMLKPDAIQSGHLGNILRDILQAGFKIKALKYTKLDEILAGKFYEVHKERGFYGNLVSFMSSGPIVAAILTKDNAVEDFRKLIGSTDPAKADPGTLRNKYASSIEANAVHGSDSNENAEIESKFFFSEFEQF